MAEQEAHTKRPDLNKDGSPRQKPGPVAKPDDAKTDRLVMRVHPDLMEILTERARECGINRSQYVEKLLIGWARLDPRNPRLDMIGKIDPAAPTPNELRRSALSFAERWQRFCTASMLLLGAEPLREWFEKAIHLDPDSDEDLEPPTPRFP